MHENVWISIEILLKFVPKGSNYEPKKQSWWGQHWAHLGPVGPRWAPYWPHESCYKEIFQLWIRPCCLGLKVVMAFVAPSKCPLLKSPRGSVPLLHYVDVKMGTIASQITSLTIVYSTVYSGADQRKHQCSASLAFVRGIHRGPVNSPHKWPVTR